MEMTVKQDVTFDSTYYPAIKYIDMDGYFVLHLDSSETLLPYEILIDSLGLAKDDVPMIGVVVGDMVIFVSVSDSPENLSRIGFPDQEKIFGWIKEHKEVLLKHWNKEISDRELANALFGEVMDILHPDHEYEEGIGHDS